MRQPLEGIRVLELAMYHAGPGAGAILGDLGAEVIKLEKPGTGDPIRQALIVGNIPFELPGGLSIWNEASNRSKKSVTINLNKDEGRAVAYRLVSKSDVFLTSLRRPAIEAMKMTYEVLCGIQPKIIYASVSGYGAAGPDRNTGAFDSQGQARSGMLYSVANPGNHPLMSQFGIIDQTTSIMTSHAIITALLMRERTGIGQEVDISLLSTALYMQYLNVLFTLTTGNQIPLSHRANTYPLRNYYKCSDGRWFMLSIPVVFDESLWPLFCRAIERPGLVNDTRFETIEKRRANSEQLISVLDDIFATRPRDEWLELCTQYDFPAAPVHRHTQLKEDPQILENNYIVSFDHPKLGSIQIPGYPIHFSKAYAGTVTAAPELGQDTEAVLSEVAGYSQKEITQLKESGVI